MTFCKTGGGTHRLWPEELMENLTYVYVLSIAYAAAALGVVIGNLPSLPNVGQQQNCINIIFT